MNGTFVRVHANVDSICTHILWADSTIHFAFENGTFASTTQTEFLSSEAAKEVAASEEPVAMDEKIGQTEARKRFCKESNTDNESDDDDLNFDDAEDKPKKSKASFVDDEADEDNDGTPEPTDVANHPRSREADDDAMMDDDAFEEEREFDGPSRSNTALMELPEPQPAFAPSSTPLDLPRRIMCWNHVGAITLLRGDDGVTRNTIDIDFTDSAFRRPLSFTDNMDFIIGSLGEDGAFFATDLADEAVDELDDDVDQVVYGLNMSDKTKAALKKSHSKRKKKGKEAIKASGSSVYFHRFETFGSLSNKDWVVTLPDGELAMGCASGTGWTACITSRRFLRTFTAGGNQGPVIWLKGDPVTIVGRSRFVAAIYHEAMPMPDGTQKLGFTVYDAISTETIATGSLSCISARSALSWAGFSKEGSLMAMDSDGMLSMLVAVEKRDANNDSKLFSWSWSPVLDTVGLRKSFEDSFWPVTAQDGKLICVPLRGGNEHPDAARRPVTSALNLRMPFAYGADKR
jgi:hypothetical protein